MALHLWTEGGPYSYEFIAGDNPNYRIRDRADNRIDTCYTETDAQKRVAELNRKYGEPHDRP